MQITETQSGFLVEFNPYTPQKYAAVKAIRGAYYRSQDKVWHIPKHQAHQVDSLKRRFGVHQTQAVMAMAEQVGEQPPMPDLDIELNLPRELFAFQKNGVAYNRIHKNVIIGDQPGLGKSTTAIATVMSYGVNAENMLNAGPGLIICPSTLKLNWRQEWKIVADRRAIILKDSIRSTWKAYLQSGMCDVFITNYESLRKYFVQPGWTKPKGIDPITKKERVFKVNTIPFKDDINIFKWIMIDESHKCKDGSTQQSKFVMGICKGKDLILELTGTPVINKPKDLIAQLTIIQRLSAIVSHIPQPVDNHGKLTDASGYKRFIDRYCAGVSGESNLRELNYRLTSTCFYRREKTEVMKDLPAKTRQVVLCDITNREEYDQAAGQFVKYLREVRGCSDQEVKKKLRGEFMVQMGILKQISAEGKLESAIEAIDEVVDGGGKIVVFVHHKKIATALKEAYPDAVTITGDDSMDSRNRSIYAFQNAPECKIIICSLQAGGVGITLTASSETLFVEFPWTYAICEQAEDRIHRIGQVEACRARYLIGDETIDNYCYFDIILGKKNLHEMVTGATDDVFTETIDRMLNLFNQK